MRHIQTKIKMAAPAHLIWNALMDFDNYPNWNPFIRSIKREQIVGKQLLVKIQALENKEITFKPEVITLDANKELKWLGQAGFEGIFNGEHYFLLEEQ